MIHFGLDKRLVAYSFLSTFDARNLEHFGVSRVFFNTKLAYIRIIVDSVFLDIAVNVGPRGFMLISVL